MNEPQTKHSFIDLVLKNWLGRWGFEDDSRVRIRPSEIKKKGDAPKNNDVLAYVAYHSERLPRTEREERAKVHFINYNAAQREFQDLILKQYVQAGISELDHAKLAGLLMLKYHALADTKNQPGNSNSIRELFVGFQSCLYKKEAR